MGPAARRPVGGSHLGRHPLGVGHQLVQQGRAFLVLGRVGAVIQAGSQLVHGGEVTVKLKDNALSFAIEPAAPKKPKPKGGKK